MVVATGAHKGGRLPIPGKDLPEVYDAVGFLRNVKLGKPDKIGKRLVVIGGGNVAFDCARVRSRLGAGKFTSHASSRGTRCSPAPDEIEEGLEEGIMLHTSQGFTQIAERRRARHRTGMPRCGFVAFEEGRLKVDFVPDSDHVIEADT